MDKESGDQFSALVVVGAQPHAELHDRPLAYGLQRDIAHAQRRRGAASPLPVIVCTDLWYLNDTTLRTLPVLAIGRPEVNAATAFLASRLPSAMIIDHRFRIHLDPEMIDRRACLWGATPADAAAAVDEFRRRYLDAFIEIAHESLGMGTDQA